jgi:hypothetical protein
MSAKHLEPVFIGPGGSAGPILASHVGSKAAELARLSALRLPAPPAFVLPTTLCGGVIAGEEEATKAMRKGVVAGIGWLEAATRRRLGDARTRLGPFGRGKVDARHARHHPERRHERFERPRPHPHDRQSAYGLRQL